MARTALLMPRKGSVFDLERELPRTASILNSMLAAAPTPEQWYALLHPMSDCKQYVTFYLHGIFFGVEVHKVQEVIRYQAMTRVPIAPAMIEGLINLRGQIVTALDLRRCLGLPARAAGQSPMNVVIRSDDFTVSLLVDEIGDVIEVSHESYERAPETFQGVARQFIEGVYKLNDKLLLILDTDRAVCTTSP